VPDHILAAEHGALPAAVLIFVRRVNFGVLRGPPHLNDRRVPGGQPCVLESVKAKKMGMWPLSAGLLIAEGSERNRKDAVAWVGRVTIGREALGNGRFRYCGTIKSICYTQRRMLTRRL
jgi:hypothetical protein